MAKNILWFLLLALIFALAVPGCATSSAPKSGRQADGSIVVVIPADKAKLCVGEGGCGLFSAARIAEIQQEAYESGADASCKKNRMQL